MKFKKQKKTKTKRTGKIVWIKTMWGRFLLALSLMALFGAGFGRSFKSGRAAVQERRLAG